MEISKYIGKRKKVQNLLHNFLDCGNESESDYNNLINFLKKQKIKENRSEIKVILHLMLKISKNYHRGPNFFAKIEKLLLFFENEIKQTFSNTELFNIFQNNKRILLFLFNSKILTIDKNIINLIFKKSDKSGTKYHHYFYPEIKTNIDEQTINRIKNELDDFGPNMLSNFEEKRQIDENDSHICQMIRNDSYEEFIEYINHTNFPLSSTITSSLFETNSFLLKNRPTLIEYAAFCGSNLIFKYLLLNNVELNYSLWLYAIHSNNADFIHLLELNHIKPSEDDSYESCLKEAIKCHHNEIAMYIQDNLSKEKVEKFNAGHNFCENIIAYSLHYFNYSFVPVNLINNEFIIYYLCEFDHITLVELLLKTKKFDLKQKVIRLLIIFIKFFFILSYLSNSNHFLFEWNLL